MSLNASVGMMLSNPICRLDTRFLISQIKVHESTLTGGYDKFQQLEAHKCMRIKIRGSEV